MEESAPKRRRTSPRTSVDVPRDATPERATPRSRKHPSFASPTKSSLARHNPQILERRLSASPSKPASPSKQSRPEIRPSAALPNDVEEDPLLDAQTAQGSGAQAGGTAVEGNATKIQEAGTPSSGGATRRPRGSLSATPRRPPKPSPRPLPPPDLEDDELNPFMGTTLRRSPKTGISIPAPEPELPRPVDDPVSSTPPRGIHSSPSRWRDKNKPKKNSPLSNSSLASSPFKSSPLKPSPLRPPELRTGSPQKGPPKKGPPQKPGLGQVLQQPLVSNRVLHDLALDPSASDIRRVLAFDANASKKKERDALQSELSALQRDLEIADRENQRIRTMQDSGRATAPSNGEEVMGLMWRHLMPLDGNALRPQSQQLVKSVLNPMGLLPFSKPSYDASFARLSLEKTAPVKSHHPLSMTAEDERPYLQLFTPFEATTEIAILPALPNQPLRQRHSITMRSRTAPGLFLARINMVVDAANLTILHLDVPALEPAAKHELGPFIDKVCTGDCNRSMQRNIGIVSWAMGEWLRVAVQRAQFWVQLERELASKDDLFETTNKLRGRKARRRRNLDEDHQEDEEDDAHSACKMTDLLHFMDHQAYEVNIPPASGQAFSSLRLEWRIEFDWTGEAQSKVAAMVGVPGKCKPPNPSSTCFLTYFARARYGPARSSWRASKTV